MFTSLRPKYTLSGILDNRLPRKPALDLDRECKQHCCNMKSLKKLILSEISNFVLLFFLFFFQRRTFIHFIILQTYVQHEVQVD